MKIIGKVKPADIPESQRGRAGKMYMELYRRVAALTPGEVLKIENDYESQSGLIRNHVKRRFKHGNYEVILRTENEKKYTYIHYNKEV